MLVVAWTVLFAAACAAGDGDELPTDRGRTRSPGAPSAGADAGAGEGAGAGDPGAGDPGAGDPGAGDPGAGDPGAGDPGAGDPGAGDPGAGDPGAGEVRCGGLAPAGAAHAPAVPAYSGGTCPRLSPGRNVLRSSGSGRELLLIVPDGYDPATEHAPLVVLWHHIGGDAEALSRDVQAQANANMFRFIAAIPEKKGDLAMDIFGYRFDPAWPYLESVSADRIREEVVFFDDMLSCIAAQYAIDVDCVSTGGVSAGGLWVPQLVERRSGRLASAVVVAGGIGPATSFGSDVRGFGAVDHHLPILIGWGGDDVCGVDFDRASRNFEARLDGHFVVECIHNCGHGPPPVDDPEHGLSLLWNFVLDHPYWLADGDSPYLVQGLREGTPSWCGIGVGSSIPRTGPCPSTTSCSVPAL